MNDIEKIKEEIDRQLAIVNKKVEVDKMSDFEIVNRDKKVDPCYGLDEFLITKEDIAALLSGKKLYSTVNCDEYAITIKMEESEEENRTEFDINKWQKQVEEELMAESEEEKKMTNLEKFEEVFGITIDDRFIRSPSGQCTILDFVDPTIYKCEDYVTCHECPLFKFWEKEYAEKEKRNET